MSSKALTEDERASLNLILEDLRYLFGKKEIVRDEIDDVLQRVESEEVKSYVLNLRYGSKPETALREAFIAGKSVLLKYLFGEASPEVRSDGFLDYLIKDEMSRGIALELKPLFEAVVKTDKAGKPILEKLRQRKLNPEDYKEQIIKYIRKGEVQFVILTDLKDWFFYSKELTPAQFKHFCAIGFFDLVKEYDVIGNLRDYLERKEFESIRYDLDKWFLESLKTWVKKLSEVDFTVDDKRKLELIIGLINKFIFVQTLDDYGVIEFNWIRKRWNYHEQMWQRKGKLMVLEKFFDELDEWFYLYYDTELFKEKILPYVKQDDENVDKLYRNLQLVLGLTYLQVPFGALKGIMQYNFRYIDEDVFGKAYETFLAEVRKDEGVYYTPKYITQYIVENTVGNVFSDLLRNIKEKLEKEELKDAKDLVYKLTAIRILDPACGSGSFLIKSIRIIVGMYRELNRLIAGCMKRYSNYAGSLDIPKENRAKLELLSEIKEIVGPENDRELISRVLLRHIHGVDLDRRALEVAKVNIWLEAIKLCPKEFRYDKLPPDTNYILPNLEMNLCAGDSLIGLPEDVAIEYIFKNHKENLLNLCKLYKRYADIPSNPELVEKALSIKHRIEERLNNEFVQLLEKENLPKDIIDETKPFHWPLGFWYLYFDSNGRPLGLRNAGFDVIIGNPPYINIRQMSKAGMDHLKLFYRKLYKSATGFYDIFVLFIEKALSFLLKNDGVFGFIISNKLLTNDYGEPIRQMVLTKSKILKIVDVSMLNVFEEAQIYPIILLCKKTAKFKSYENTVDMITALNLHNIDEGLKVIVTQSELKGFEKSVIPIPSNSRTFEVLRKIAKQGIPIKKLFTLNSGTAGFQYRSFGDCLVDSKPISGQALPFIVTGNIDHYHIDLHKKVHYLGRELVNPYLMYNEHKITKGKWELFNKSKIVIRGMALSLTAAYDEDGVATGVSTYLVTGFEENGIDPLFATALLNSKVLDFYYKALFLSKHLAGEWIGYNVSQLEGLPFVIPDSDVQKKIAELVWKIMTMKESVSTFSRIWEFWATKLKNSEKTLNNILSDDLAKLRNGEKDVWTIKAIILSDERQGQKKVFKQFNLAMHQGILEITGLTEDGKETTLATLHFRSDELLTHTYLAITRTLRSGLKIETLEDLLNKTKVPLVLPNYVTNTASIMTCSIKEYERQMKKAISIPSILKQLEETEIEIDANIFLLYGLQKEEVQHICEYLNLNETYKTKLLEKFVDDG